MKIAYVCASHKPINQVSVGGIETFTIYLLNALKELGHGVTLFSAKETDSSLFPGINIETTFEIKALDENASTELESKSFTLNYTALQCASLAKVMSSNQQYDIIHFSSAQWYIPLFMNISHAPILSTIHVNNLYPKIQEYLLETFPSTHLASVSHFSGKSFDKYSRHHVVHNGIDINKFRFNSMPQDYVGWLGRISPVKGLKEALQASQKAHVPLRASGSIDFQDYYNKEVVPLLDKDRVLTGPLNTDEKNDFLSHAKAILMPVQWDEPFGLVAIEAMACGTPVIAFRRGGLQEIIKDGVNGFLVDTVDEMAEKIHQVDSLDRNNIRKYIESNFSAKSMAQNYVSYYNKAIAFYKEHQLTKV